MNPLSDQDKSYATSLFQNYFNMMTKGCGNRQCSTASCCSSASNSSRSVNDIAAECLVLAANEGPAQLCATQRLQFEDDVAEGPETDELAIEDDDDWHPQSSTPRKKLVDALLLDQTLSGLFVHDKKTKGRVVENERRYA